jgi:hypothetical protein
VSSEEDFRGLLALLRYWGVVTQYILGRKVEKARNRLSLSPTSSARGLPSRIQAAKPAPPGRLVPSPRARAPRALSLPRSGLQAS